MKNKKLLRKMKKLDINEEKELQDVERSFNN